MHNQRTTSVLQTIGAIHSMLDDKWNHVNKLLFFDRSLKWNSSLPKTHTSLAQIGSHTYAKVLSIYMHIYIKNDFAIHWAYSQATLRKIRKIATLDISRLQWNDLDIANCNPNQLCTIIEFNRPYIIDHNIFHLYKVSACDFPKPFRRLKVHMKMSDQQRNYIFK